MTPMPPSRFLMQAMFGAADKVAALMGAEPGHWLTMADRRKPRDLHSVPVRLHLVDGRSYLIDILPKGWSRDLRIPGPGTLTVGRTDTDVTVTEVTDPTVKHQVVIADAANKTKTLFAFGEGKNREPTSLLVTLGIAKDDTPEGLASAVPRVAVFEVTPA
jgi:hypothetical protein